MDERQFAQLASTMDADSLHKLAADRDAAKSDADDARSAMENVLKGAENDHGVHRQAFKWAMRLRDMESTKRAAQLTHLRYYVHVFGLDAQHELQLVEAAE